MFLALKLEKGVDCSSIQNFVLVCHLISVKKYRLIYWINVRAWLTYILTSQQFWKLTNGVTLKYMLQAVYYVGKLNFDEHRENLSLLFSDLQFSANAYMQN